MAAATCTAPVPCSDYDLWPQNHFLPDRNLNLTSIHKSAEKKTTKKTPTKTPQLTSRSINITNHQPCSQDMFPPNRRQEVCTHTVWAAPPHLPFSVGLCLPKGHFKGTNRKCLTLTRRFIEVSRRLRFEEETSAPRLDWFSWRILCCEQKGNKRQSRHIKSRHKRNKAEL